MFVIHNGKLTEDSNGISITNRAYQYGDAVFETIKFRNGDALYINDHFERLKKGMQMLGYEMPHFFSIEYFSNQFKELTQKNNCHESARIRLQVYRNGYGYYFPSSSQAGYTITAVKNEIINYKLNESPIKINAYTENHKSKSPLCNLKTSSALLYVVAANYTQQNNLDDCLILNDNGNVAEAISSNIFIITDSVLITSPLTDGGVEGVMRKQLIKLAAKQNINCIEKSLSIDEVMSAEEILLTNVIKGISTVKCNEIHKPMIQQFIDLLNE